MRHDCQSAHSCVGPARIGNRCIYYESAWPHLEPGVIQSQIDARIQCCVAGGEDVGVHIGACLVLKKVLHDVSVHISGKEHVGRGGAEVSWIVVSVSREISRPVTISCNIAILKSVSEWTFYYLAKHVTGDVALPKLRVCHPSEPLYGLCRVFLVVTQVHEALLVSFVNSKCEDSLLDVLLSRELLDKQRACALRDSDIFPG